MSQSPPGATSPMLIPGVAGYGTTIIQQARHVYADMQNYITGASCIVDRRCACAAIDQHSTGGTHAHTVAAAGPYVPSRKAPGTQSSLSPVHTTTP